MAYTYTKAITGSWSSLDKKINDYLENAPNGPEVLDIKITEITKPGLRDDVFALLILQEG